VTERHISVMLHGANGKRFGRRAFSAFGALCLLARGALAGPSGYALRRLVSTAGGTTSLAEVAAGKTLIVVVMKGHWCPVCRAEVARLGARSARFRELGARLCALNADAPAANRAIAEKFGLAMPILSDADHAVLAALGLWREGDEHPLPAALVFDACGNEVERFLGRDATTRSEAALLDVARRLHDAPPQCSVA
jgi:peroxiredoxin